MRGFASTLSSLSTQRAASRWYLEAYPSSPSSFGRNFTGRRGGRQASDRHFALSVAGLALASRTRLVVCFNPKACQVILRCSRTIHACGCGTAGRIACCTFLTGKIAGFTRETQQGRRAGMAERPWRTGGLRTSEKPLQPSST